MKRVTEKVRDIVEVCPFTHLHDFAADPGLTLAGYHFTDITADLMAKWLDRVTSVKAGNGAALALAGFRGVGKSHFLSVVGAIVSRPDLRAGLTDSHVAAAAERLSRRHGPVASVRRGTGTSLMDEVERAIAELIGVNPGTLNDSLQDLLLRASKHAADMPLVILIDTALDRSSRVARDDGVLLSEMAEAAKALGIFVGVALDDDISGADGANSSIAGNFTIDYLDQEHLYKIVDTHIFAKHGKMRPLLRDIYANYREVLPGFRWSEQRFSSLYPLHPATLEIAPLIRLYIHDFALLGFASETGVRILGRPANSLIGLDEVFDSVESKLRLVPDLSDAFAAFDKVDQEVVAKTPVQFRLQAKLILKGLLMLSLDDRGSTAAEIAAAMMIYNEPESKAPPTDIAEILDSFVAALPVGIEKFESDGAEPRYCFKPDSKDEINSVLAEAAKDVSDDIVEQVLRRHTADKYSDVDTDSAITPCTVEWRGAVMRGEIVWKTTKALENEHQRDDRLDWMVSVESIGSDDSVSQSIAWHLADLTVDEKETVKRNYLLHNDGALREQFADGVATAAHVHSIAVEKIWQRIFLRDASMQIAGTIFKFAENATSAHSLSQLFSENLASIFESQFPAHPEFSRSLGAKESSNLIESFFSGFDVKNAEIQKLAVDLAFPLGLAVRNGDEFMPASSDALWELGLVKSAFGEMERNTERPIAIAEICSGLQAPPFGLTREAQHLVMAAMVAQRQFEFVTASGDRINHRSLDLQIIWDDIVGLAKPADEVYSPERLVSWAKLITGNSGVRRLERNEDRQSIINSLSEWLSEWRERRILEHFDALPDENLNAAVWRTAANLRKSFGGMAETIESLIENDVSLDQCLHSIAERFSDSEMEYEKKKGELGSLRDYIAGVSRRDEITAFLAVCEICGDTAIEDLRQNLLDFLCSGEANFVEDKLESQWNDFKTMFADHYRDKHDAVMKSMALGQALNAILRSDEWAAFESVSAHPWFDQGYAAMAKTLVREMRQLKCTADVKELLSAKPYCRCPFNLADFDRLIDLPNQLQATISQGVESFRLRLLDNGETLVEIIDGISASDKAGGAAIIRSLAEFTSNGTLPRFTSHEIQILCKAAEQAGDVNFAETSVVTDDGDFYDGVSRFQPTPLNADLFGNAEN